MVEFLKDIKDDDYNFTYKKGKKYCSINDSTEESLKDIILIRQPNSPKSYNYWAKFGSSCIDVVFKIVSEDEMSLAEKLEEDRVLQL